MLNNRQPGIHRLFSRRDFLKLAALSAGTLALRPFAKLALPRISAGRYASVPLI